MNDWWWQVIVEFYQRVATARHRDPSEPAPEDYAQGMLALIDRIAQHPDLSAVKPGVYRRTLTLRPSGCTRRILVRWVLTGLYEIELEEGAELVDLPWDGRIMVPDDVVIQALVTCKQRLEGAAPDESQPFSSPFAEG